MTPKQTTIVVFMVFTIFVVFIFSAYRFLFPPNIDPGDILYIVQPGLNYGNQLGLVFVVICIVGFFLTFYIPVIKNWDKDKCNDGITFLAPLFDKDANQTLKECARQTLVEPKLPTISSTIPANVSSQLQYILTFINNKINEIQALMSTKQDTLVTQQLRDKLIKVADSHRQIQKREELNNRIIEKRKEVDRLKNTLDYRSWRRREADKRRGNQQRYINIRRWWGFSISRSTHATLASYIAQQTEAQNVERLAKQDYDRGNNELNTLQTELGTMNPWWMRMLLNWHVTDARSTIK